MAQLIVLTVGQAQRVSELMYRLDKKTVGEKVHVVAAIRKTPASTDGKKPPLAAPLIWASPKTKVRIGMYRSSCCNPQQPPRVAVYEPLHGGEDLGGMILLPLGVQRKGGVESGQE